MRETFPLSLFSCSAANERVELSVEVKSYAYNVQAKREQENTLPFAVLVGNATSAVGDTSGQGDSNVDLIHG